MNKNTKITFPAEWEKQDAIMLSWPHQNTDWAYMLNEVKACFKNIAKAIVDNDEHLIIIAPNIEEAKTDLTGVDLSLVNFYEIPTNDTWARDTMAITTYNAGKATINDFKFNGWGLKFAADKDNLITSLLYNNTNLFEKIEYANHLSFVLEGGSVESDSKGTLLTTSECLLSPNRNGAHSKDEIEEYLKKAFGVNRILWLDYGALAGDDTDSHIDTLARFSDDKTIIYTCTNNEDDIHYNSLQMMKEQIKSFTTEDGHPYRTFEVPLPHPIYDEDGERLPATYANFLIGNGFILVPTYKQPDIDATALAIIQEAFPNHKIIGIDCTSLIKQHGSLHCVTMQFPQNSLNLQ